MKKFKKSLILTALAATAICGISVAIFNKANAVEVSATQHKENFELYDYQNYSGSYYDFLGTDSLSEGLSGTLRTKLTQNILPKDWYSYSGSGEKTLSTILQQADEDPSNPNNMVFLYTRDSVTKQAAGTWNREHTWPQSLSGDNWGKGNAGTDILHLRPTYQTPNSTRGNNKFAEISGGTKRTYNGMDFGYTSGSNFMPLDAVKGDVARIIMYVWVAYKDYYSSMPNVTNVFESYDTLLKWHTQDKPDMMEAHRNDVAEASYQKNRNPFVDHPEFAWKIFGDSASASVKAACKSAYPDSDTPTKTLSSISVSGTPTKTTYTAGESFNVSGLTVTANFSDGSSDNVTSKVTSSPNPLTVGTTSVTLSYTNGATKTATYSGITVNKAPVNVTKVEASLPSSSYFVGDVANIQYKVYPDNADNKTVQFTSTNTSVASVDTTGKVNFREAGSTTLNVISKADTSRYASINVSVSERPVSDIPVESVSFDACETDVKVGDAIQLFANVLPENATNKTLTYSSNNEPVATVSTTGKVSFMKDGSVTITATAHNGVSTSIDFVVSSDEPVPTKELVEIDVKQIPNKTVYQVGETFSAVGLVVEAHYLDGTSEDISDDISITRPSTSRAGKKVATVTYGDFKTTFEIEVVESPILTLNVTKNPAKTGYFADEEFLPIGLVIEGTCENGDVIEDVSELASFSYDFSSSGKVTITVGSATVKLDVEVLEGTPTDEHEAADFTYVFEDKIEDVAKEEVTLDQWKVLEYYFNQLDANAKKVLRNIKTTASSGEVSAAEDLSEQLKECASDYDEIYLANKSKGFNDFMGRNPKLPPVGPGPTIVDPEAAFRTAVIVICIVSVCLVAIVIPVEIVRAKKAKKNA